MKTSTMIILAAGGVALYVVARRRAASAVSSVVPYYLARPSLAETVPSWASPTFFPTGVVGTGTVLA